MDQKVSAKERLIKAASTLFSRQGYDGTGLSQLLLVSEAPKGSFYYHFPKGKEQLAEETILQSGAEIRAMIDKCFSQADSFETGARAYGKSIGKWFKSSNYSEGCPITSVLLATVPESDRLKAASETVLLSWRDMVASHAKRFGLEDRAEELGEAMVLGLEGAWILSRAIQSTKPFDTAIDMTLSLAKQP